MERTDHERNHLPVPGIRGNVSTSARDWLWFAAATVALSALHIATAFASGLLPTSDMLDGLLYYAGKGWLGPLAGLAYVGLHAAALKPSRPGRTAARAALFVGAIAYVSALETRTLFSY